MRQADQPERRRPENFLHYQILDIIKARIFTRQTMTDSYKRVDLFIRKEISNSQKGTET